MLHYYASSRVPLDVHMNDSSTREAISSLTLEFLAWIAIRPRTYAETMEAWRSTCPRSSVWEDALIAGLIQLDAGGAIDRSEVILTPQGRAVLDERPRPASSNST